MSVLSGPKVFRLSHADDHNIWVLAEDGDQFTMPAPEAAKACQLLDQCKEQISRREEQKTQVKKLWEKLQAWAKDHESAVREAYLQVRPDKQFFLVVLKGDECDYDLERSLTRLTIDVANDEAFALVNLDVQTLPACSHDDIRSFIIPAGADPDGEF